MTPRMRMILVTTRTTIMARMVTQALMRLTTITAAGAMATDRGMGRTNRRGR
jgi:hypothetical protein